MDYMNFCPLRLINKDFDSFIKPFHSRRYYRPLSKNSNTKDFGSTIEETKDKFMIYLDVLNFRPNEINVKVTDKEIIVEGKHGERHEDSSFVSRHFTRRYPLPSNCPAENVYSTLSSDGVLSVIAEKITSIQGNEKIVPIQISGSRPMKTHGKSSITQTSTGITQKDIDDAIREARELISMDKAKLAKEEHSCLLSQERFKESVSEKKEELNEKLNMSSGEEKLTNMKGSDLVDQVEQNSSVSSSDCFGATSSLETIREEKKTYKSTMTSSMKASECISAELSVAAENL